MVDPLSTSDKPLDRDVIKSPPREFSATFMEWVADNIEQITEARLSTTAQDMYVVPDKFTLFVTSAFVSALCTSGAPSGRSVILTINGNEDERTIIATSIVGGNTASNNSISFNMPIKVNSGETVRGILSLANVRGRWGFHGFLLPKKISIR